MRSWVAAEQVVHMAVALIMAESGCMLFFSLLIWYDSNFEINVDKLVKRSITAVDG